MKSNSRKAVEFGLTGALSTDIPGRPRFRLPKAFALLAAAALFSCAAFGLSQSAKAEGAFTVAGTNSTLPSWSQDAKAQESSPSRRQIADDSAIFALTSFAQQIGAAAPKSGPAKTSQTSSSRQFDDQTLAALRDFAQGMGADQPASLKGQTRVADADTLMDWLAGKKTPEAPAAIAPKAKGSKRSAVPVEAHFIGSQACATCHAPLIAEFKKTLMGKISDTPQGKGKFECENCHGPGSAHVNGGGGRGVGGIMSFEADDPRSAEEKNSICLACHQKGERTYWAGSVHETRGLACTNCHTVMKAVSRKYQLKTPTVVETCFQCHKLQRAQIQYSSHMPIREGKVTCTDCHNPHGSTTEKLIREASVNDNCYKCHAEKRGPFLWEHQPVRENCLNCHVPHGSNYESLLKVARPRLCNECHAFAHGNGGFDGPNNPTGTARVLGNACGNCHSNIHGSNQPNGMFFLR